MKIVYLAAGAGGMYCGSCLHDNTLAAALLALGQDVLLVPTYTPLRTDEDNVSDSHLFFGGINVYLQQHSALFRHTPWFLDTLLDNANVINWVTKGGPSIDAKKLGGLTVSMLEGEHGRQRKEIRKLVHWLERDARPDVVHLSNAMLMGMAREIRKLGIPVVASLSGEDVFLEQLAEPFYSRARADLRDRANDVDAFVALNHYYADFMADYMSVARDRIDVVPHGLKLEGHGTRRIEPERSFTIGYLARICPEKGLHNLIAAAELLSADSTTPPFRIQVAGYLGDRDRDYLNALLRRVESWALPDKFAYVGELSRDEKIQFLQGLDCFALPTEYRESKGLSVLEAMANAVPVVLPDHGTFPELVQSTGGGLLHRPHEPGDLAERLKQLVQARELATELGLRGQQAIRRDYHSALMAQKTLAVYQRLKPIG